MSTTTSTPADFFIIEQGVEGGDLGHHGTPDDDGHITGIDCYCRPERVAWVDGEPVAMLDHLRAELDRYKEILDDAPGRFAESDHLIPKWAKDLRKAERHVEQLRADVASWVDRARKAERKLDRDGHDDAKTAARIAATLALVDRVAHETRHSQSPASVAANTLAVAVRLNLTGEVSA